MTNVEANDTMKNPPAFPTETGRQVGHSTYHFEGMSLRDYFAGQALTGVLAGWVAGHDRTPYTIAAYSLADAMLAQRQK